MIHEVTKRRDYVNLTPVERVQRVVFLLAVIVILMDLLVWRPG